MSDARDTNHDGKVSIMEKVKGAMHHKNGTAAAHTTSTTPLTTSFPPGTTTFPPGTTFLPANSVNVPANAVPIMGYAPVALAPTAVAAPAVVAAPTYNTAAPTTVAYTTTTSATPLTGAAYDSRDLNRDGYVSTTEKMQTSGVRSTGAYDSRDLNRDGIVSATEQLAATHIGSHQTEEARLRLHEEQLAISKREVGAGEVDIHKRVHEQHVSQTVPVRHEEVIVERRPLSGVTDPNYRISSQDETMRVALYREEIVTEKRIVPTEEVIVRKTEVVDQQVVGATLRSEHVETVQTNTHSSSILGGNTSSNFVGSSNLTGAHDTRDTNFDGKVSLGEKVKGAVTGNKGSVVDSRDTNRDGKVSLGEKVKGAAARG